MEEMQGMKKTYAHRFTVLGACVVAAAILISLMIWHHFGTKQITMSVNGEVQLVQTRQETVQGLLQELQVPYKGQDRLSKMLSTPLKHGDEIELLHTLPVQVTIAGKEMIDYTVGTTIGEVIDDLNIEVGTEDEVVPALDTRIEEADKIEIIRVQKEIETYEEPIPAKTVKVQDNNLLQGKERVVHEGSEGIKVITLEKKFENDELVASNIIATEIKRESENKIVAVGTRKPVAVLSASSPDVTTVTKDGITFGVKQILENVTLTAYDAGFNSTGKTSDHPYYGITYSGTKVEEGRTVAVDPKVIPLGWWIYIEGIGLRKAEDIGSAIKGKKIDVYYESEDVANRFGVKKGYKVYVIGAKKPSEA